ncbi:unnamed protein product, partial [Rotaria magnacalcarata]
LGKPLTIYDLESLDPEFYNGLLWIRENNLDLNENLELYFNTSFDFLGKIESIELKTGGNDIKLTEENKAEYIELMTKWRFTRCVEEQTKAFLYGFNEVSSPESFFIQCKLDMHHFFAHNSLDYVNTYLIWHFLP